MHCIIRIGTRSIAAMILLIPLLILMAILLPVLIIVILSIAVAVGAVSILASRVKRIGKKKEKGIIDVDYQVK